MAPCKCLINSNFGHCYPCHSLPGASFNTTVWIYSLQWVCQAAQWSRTLLPMHEMQERESLWSLSQEDSLEKEMETYSIVLAQRIPWTEEPGGLQSMRLQGVRRDWTHIHSRQILSEGKMFKREHNPYWSQLPIKVKWKPCIYTLQKSFMCVLSPGG